jgi:hypothetical protein
MTVMETFLATAALAVPLIIGIRGTLLASVPQYGLARTPSVPCGNYPRSWKSNSPAALGSHGATEVQP